MAFQLVHAIDTIHRNNVMHRDIKLDNICLSGDWFDIRDYVGQTDANNSASGASSSASSSASSASSASSSTSDTNNNEQLLSSFKCPQIKIVDFGLGKIVEQDDSTTTGGVGTIEYCAPEVLVARTKPTKYAHKVDVWSVGVTCWILLTGKPPFWPGSGQTRMQLSQRIIEDGAPFDRADFKQIGEQAKDFVEYCLIKDCEDRLSPRDLLNQSEWLKPWTKSLKLANDDVKTPSFSNDPIHIEEPLREYRTESAKLNTATVKENFLIKFA
eukprot:CAMPEP_0201545626 /NCGR_PEP_ID=MMETSP0173_2-20130828/2079_1 /ASSEMBLY_ACC=CAM_ASM_000268 /TAXON_ID=218659 /ORGANISM="Vexillifera sp., Strain DIVA3 564/2" /LENGTH=269 /DNA_ID=CAMNT_0047954069 /DNA_START=66 /DNA_END=872 /DNA_ORIENTATION=-